MKISSQLIITESIYKYVQLFIVRVNSKELRTPDIFLKKIKMYLYFRDIHKCLLKFPTSIRLIHSTPHEMDWGIRLHHNIWQRRNHWNKNKIMIQNKVIQMSIFSHTYTCSKNLQNRNFKRLFPNLYRTTYNVHEIKQKTV